jgi:hypothetical protein
VAIPLKPPCAAVAVSHREEGKSLSENNLHAGLNPLAKTGSPQESDEICTLCGFLKSNKFGFGETRWEAVRDAMPALFDMLEKEIDPGVRAVLGHWLYGYIHPYPDGNGRMARFLMNAMLASGGYPWTVIRVDDRDAYLAALDRASIDANIQPFATFIAERVQWSLDQARAKVRAGRV